MNLVAKKGSKIFATVSWDMPQLRDIAHDRGKRLGETEPKGRFFAHRYLEELGRFTENGIKVDAADLESPET